MASDLESLAGEAIDLYEGLLDRARRQRMLGNKKAWAREATIEMLRIRRPQVGWLCPGSRGVVQFEPLDHPCKLGGRTAVFMAGADHDDAERGD